MRILDLTPAALERLLRARRRRDADAERVAARIVADVRRRGDAALAAWTRRLDGAACANGGLVSATQLRDAWRDVDPAFRRALARAARNIRRVARRQRPREWQIEVEPGVRVAQAVRPIAAVGCYVPGGRFALVSTMLMTVIPAQVAGVPRVAVVCPRPTPEVLAAAALLGVTEVRAIGGAQAIAALAYGTRSIAPVDRIVGPGNRYVTAAKRRVSADCPIDFVAGPTELLVLAHRGNPRTIAADLVAQAEHDPDAVAVLVTTSRLLARRVRAEVRRQTAALPGSMARAALRRNGAILIAPSADAAAEFANRFAAEHLSIPDPVPLRSVTAAGSVFVGPWTAQPLGDFATGSNHTLPTSGAARARGGLSTADFVKCIAVQRVSRAGLRRLAPVVAAFAKAENLPAHERAVALRLVAPRGRPAAGHPLPALPGRRPRARGAAS